MKKLIYSFLFLGTIISLSSCKEDSFEDLIPQKYEKILYLTTSGQQNLALFNDGSNVDYTVTVGKTGSNPAATAMVQLKVMTQAEIDKDEHYTGNNYTVFSNECYIYKAQALEFKSGDTYKSVTLQLVPEKMVEEIHACENPDAVFILPFRLTSQTDSVNTDKCDLILKPKITELSIAFKKGSKTINLTDNKENSIIFETDIAMVAGVQNTWDFTADMEVLTDQSILDKYNSDNNTNYLMIPTGAFSDIEAAVFEAGNNESAGTVTIRRDHLSKGYTYLLPLRLKAITEYENIAVSDKIFYGIVEYPLDMVKDKITLTTTMLADPFGCGGGDGTVLANLVDGATNTYYHTQYGKTVGDPTYGQPVDITLDNPVKSVMFSYVTRHNNGNATPQTIKLFTSNDGENWTELTTINSGLPVDNLKTYTSKIFAATEEFKYLRFSVIRSRLGECDGSSVGPCWALAELELWGSN